MYEPSLVISVFSSRRKNMLEVTLRTCLTFAASELAARSRATLSTIGIVNGAVWIGLFHSPTWLPGVGASTTGWSWLARLALACVLADLAIEPTACLVSWLVAAKPPAPYTSVGTPMP